MAGGPASRLPFRAYILTTAAFQVSLLAAGAVYARTKEVEAAVAAPVVAAFLAQAALFLLAGFPEAREALAARLSKPRFAMLLTAAALAPYLIYAVPLGAFSPSGFLKLACLYAIPPFLFVLFPPRLQKLTWQDAAVLAILVTPVISGATDLFREVFPSPGEPVPRLDVLGKLGVFSVGALSFLCLRGVERAGFQFRITRADWRAGVRNYLLYLPVGVPLALALGFVDWGPREPDGWTFVLAAAGKALGIYFATALPEELCFRGILQNLLAARLGREAPAQVLSALLFGAVHLSFRTFPNWEFAVLAAVAGWFYGRAYRQTRSTTAAATAHTLVVVTWFLLSR